MEEEKLLSIMEERFRSHDYRHDREEAVRKERDDRYTEDIVRLTDSIDRLTKLLTTTREVMIATFARIGLIGIIGAIVLSALLSFVFFLVQRSIR